MRHYRFNFLATCLLLASGLQVGVASAIDIVGRTSAILNWGPASGPVAMYGIYVSRNGQPFSYEPETVVTETSATLHGTYGDSVVVRVAGLSALDQRGPFSEVSDEIRFLASEPIPDPTIDPDPEPDSSPAADPSLACEDFDADGRSDLFWSDGGAGANEVWFSTTDDSAVLPVPDLGDSGFELTAAGDFDGDGHGDILWRDPATGDTVLWLLRDGELAHEAPFEPMDSNWEFAGVGDHNLDGRDDLIWYRPKKLAVKIWLMDGGDTPKISAFRHRKLNGWKAVAIGDHDGDRRLDIYWHQPLTGENRVTRVDGRKARQKLKLPTVGASWVFSGVGDFDGDSRSDLVWHEPESGGTAIWLHGLQEKHGPQKKDGLQGAVREEFTDDSAPGWNLVGMCDHDGDGRTDLIWHEPASGDTTLWIMEGSVILEEVYLGQR